MFIICLHEFMNSNKSDQSDLNSSVLFYKIIKIIIKKKHKNVLFQKKNSVCASVLASFQ